MPEAARPNEADEQKLAAEAEYLHRILFGSAAPEEIRRQYTAALSVHPLANPVPIERLIAAGADLEAIELALRKTNPANALTTCFRVLCYLAEARPEYFTRFVAERRHFAGGAVALAFHAARTLYKSIKGGLLLWRYGLR
jgi:hypothetical protein